MFRPAIVLVVLLGYFGHLRGQGKFSWMRYDRFDEVNDHLKTVDAQNCRSKSKRDLVLRPDTVAQLPVYNELLDRVWYKNRSTLIHLHNMALNRAMFYSYILQKMNDSASFYLQPNWLYMYMSVTADVNANPSMVNGSAIYFDTNCHYPNWYAFCFGFLIYLFFFFYFMSAWVLLFVIIQWNVIYLCLRIALPFPFITW